MSGTEIYLFICLFIYLLVVKPLLIGHRLLSDTPFGRGDEDFLLFLPLLRSYSQFNKHGLACFGQRRWHITIRNKKWRLIKNFQTHVSFVIALKWSPYRLYLKKLAFTEKLDANSWRTPDKRAPPIFCDDHCHLHFLISSNVWFTLIYHPSRFYYKAKKK